MRSNITPLLLTLFLLGIGTRSAIAQSQLASTTQPAAKVTAPQKTIYVAPHDVWPPPFPGTYTPLLWAGPHMVRSGTAGLNVNEADVKALAEACRDGNPAYPTWGGTMAIAPGTALCFDVDWYMEPNQFWTAEQVGEMCRIVKATAPQIPLTGYNATTVPLADHYPALTPQAYAELRRKNNLEAYDQWLDFFTIRFPLLRDYEESQLEALPGLVETQRSYSDKPVYVWLRGDYVGGTKIPDASLDRYARTAMECPGAAGVVIWGDRGSIPGILAACQKYLPRTPGRTPYRPLRPASREPFKP